MKENERTILNARQPNIETYLMQRTRVKEYFE